MLLNSILRYRTFCMLLWCMWSTETREILCMHSGCESIHLCWRHIHNWSALLFTRSKVYFVREGCVFPAFDPPPVHWTSMVQSIVKKLNHFQQLFVKNSYTEFRKSPKSGYISDIRLKKKNRMVIPERISYLLCKSF